MHSNFLVPVSRWNSTGPPTLRNSNLHPAILSNAIGSSELATLIPFLFINVIGMPISRGLISGQNNPGGSISSHGSRISRFSSFARPPCFQRDLILDSLIFTFYWAFDSVRGVALGLGWRQRQRISRSRRFLRADIKRNSCAPRNDPFCFHFRMGTPVRRANRTIALDLRDSTGNPRTQLPNFLASILLLACGRDLPLGF